jgi:hypothetical protein
VPCGQAFERGAFSRGPKCPIEAAQGAWLQTQDERNITMSKTTNRPSHRIYAVTKNGDRSFWQPIGAAWAHNDGDGFNLKLEYLPLNTAEIVIRKPKAVEADAPADQAA